LPDLLQAFLKLLTVLLADYGVMNCVCAQVAEKVRTDVIAEQCMQELTPSHWRVWMMQQAEARADSAVGVCHESMDIANDRLTTAFDPVSSRLVKLIEALHGVLNYLVVAVGLDTGRCMDFSSPYMVSIMPEPAEEMGVCRHDGKCTFKTMLQVRRVNADEKPFGKTLLIDGAHVKPHLNQNYEAGLAIVRGMSHFWTKDTPVLLQFHKAHTDIMRHSTECFAKKDAMHLQPEVCQVVSSSFVVHLREFVSYMCSTSTWGDQELGEVSSSIKSFVSARLSGFNLNEECVLCFEPLRHFPQVRLGCACGADGSVKGRVLHMKCADKWLREQANIWRDGYGANDRAAVGGPVGPSCPVCIQRLQGIPPRVTDLHARPLSPVEGLDVVRVINIADDELTFNLYEEMDRKMANIPITLARILHGEPDTERVDESMKCAILTYKKCVLFPSAQQLFACSGHERRRDCDFPGPATAVASNEDLHFMGVENYNKKVYYAALGCWLRWTRQFLRNGPAQA